MASNQVKQGIAGIESRGVFRLRERSPQYGFAFAECVAQPGGVARVGDATATAALTLRQQGYADAVGSVELKFYDYEDVDKNDKPIHHIWVTVSTLEEDPIQPLRQFSQRCEGLTLALIKVRLDRHHPRVDPDRPSLLLEIIDLPEAAQQVHTHRDGALKQQIDNNQFF